MNWLAAFFGALCRSPLTRRFVFMVGSVGGGSSPGALRRTTVAKYVTAVGETLADCSPQLLLT